MANLEVRTAVKEMGDAEVHIQLVKKGQLYQGYEHLIKPGKPRRLLIIQ